MGRRSEHCTMAPHPLLYLLFAGAFVTAGVGPQKDRVLQARPLSDKERVEGDYAYDHDAFLGEDQAEEFDQLDPAESRRRLAVIVGRMDEDRDGLVSEEELQRWIRNVQEREVMEDTERQWEERNKPMYAGDPEGRVSWESYKNDIYGFVEEVGEERNGYSFEPMMDQDLRRWTAADSDGDMLLTKLEFQAFLHPEESAHMKDIIVLETMEDMDKDGDSRLSLEEYIGDLYPGQEDGDGFIESKAIVRNTLSTGSQTQVIEATEVDSSTSEPPTLKLRLKKSNASDETEKGEKTKPKKLEK